MKTKRTTIAAVAHNCSTGDSDKNLALMEEVLVGGETSETDIYVFPELNISGGVISKTDLVNLGETVPDGSHVEEVCSLAKRYRTAICAGLVETSTDGMFLTHFIATPDGYAGSQRKLIPQNPTKAGPFKSGQVLTPIDLDGTKVAILACADFLLPEPSIAAALESIDLILSPTDSFAASMSSKLKTLQAARAMDCNAHVIAAFHIDVQTQSEQIAVIASDPEGRTLLHKTTSNPGTHVFRLDVDLQRTPPRWGGLPARVQLLKKMLGPYSC